MIPILYADLIDDAQHRVRFEEIYETYYQQMFYVANKILSDPYEAEDALHDAFIGIARNMHTVSTITDRRDLFYYLMRSAENAAYNRTRQTKHYAELTEADHLPSVSDRSLWDTLYNKTDYEQLLRSISALPQIYREVLYYHYVLEFSMPDTARSLDIKLAAAKQRLVRGKKLLMQAIAAEGELNYGND